MWFIFNSSRIKYGYTFASCVIWYDFYSFMWFVLFFFFFRLEWIFRFVLYVCFSLTEPSFPQDLLRYQKDNIITYTQKRTFQLTLRSEKNRTSHSFFLKKYAFLFSVWFSGFYAVVVCDTHFRNDSTQLQKYVVDAVRKNLRPKKIIAKNHELNAEFAEMQSRIIKIIKKNAHSTTHTIRIIIIIIRLPKCEFASNNPIFGIIRLIVWSLHNTLKPLCAKIGINCVEKPNSNELKPKNQWRVGRTRERERNTCMYLLYIHRENSIVDMLTCTTNPNDRKNA